MLGREDVSSREEEDASRARFWVHKAWTTRTLSGWRLSPPGDPEQWEKELGIFLESTSGLSVARLAVSWLKSLPDGGCEHEGLLAQSDERTDTTGHGVLVLVDFVASGQVRAGAGKRRRAGNESRVHDRVAAERGLEGTGGGKAMTASLVILPAGVRRGVRVREQAGNRSVMSCGDKVVVEALVRWVASRFDCVLSPYRLAPLLLQVFGRTRMRNLALERTPTHTQKHTTRRRHTHTHTYTHAHICMTRVRGDRNAWARGQRRRPVVEDNDASGGAWSRIDCHVSVGQARAFLT